MFMFQGFENALYDSQVQLLKLLNGISSSIGSSTTFRARAICATTTLPAQAFDGVVAAYRSTPR